MKINSKDFGILDIEQEEVLHFPNGVFAFEDVKDFVLIEKDGYKQKWLQSVKAENPRFIVFDPADIIDSYDPDIPAEVFKELRIGADDKTRIYVIAVIPENIKDMTVNLKSPIIVNPKKHLAAQIIIEKGNYPVRHRIFKEDGRGI